MYVVRARFAALLAHALSFQSCGSFVEKFFHTLIQLAFSFPLADRLRHFVSGTRCRQSTLDLLVGRRVQDEVGPEPDEECKGRERSTERRGSEGLRASRE